MDLVELKSLIAKGEDSKRQFKEDVRNIDSLAAEIVAFSNSRGGIIFIGVSNKGALTGLSSDDIDRINQLISNAANQHVRSPVTVHTENIATSADRVVIALTIPEGIDKPYFDHHGVIWLKSGADKRRVNSKEELRRLFQDVDLLHADEVPTRAGVEILNIKLFSDFFQKVYRESLPESHLERTQLLENMNLVNGNRLNLAGLLLFGNKPQVYKPEFVVKAVYFAGIKITDSYIDSEDFEGPLSEVFQNSLAFIMRNLRKVQKHKGVNTVGEPEIPESVFEELLVNALIHRDYFITAPIRLFIFEDRIEIINPGYLPNHLTVEKIVAGNSVQRNPILASFAAKGLLPYRGLGTGVRRALQYWSKIEFIDNRDDCTFTSITFRDRA
jgi:ATP-dependent DNA helicase RecG